MSKAHHHQDLKRHVSLCMVKLSDRDTEPMAASELESMARTLSPDHLPPFLAAISDSRPSDKTPLRRHSLRLLSILSQSHPSHSLSPHVPKMLSAVLRRVQDADSSVRSASVDAIRSIAASNPSSISSVLFKPLSDSMLHEQDRWAQMTSALCLSAAIEESARDDLDLIYQMRRLLPRLVKLARSNAFKAKPALVDLMGSVAGNGGASTESLMRMLIPILVELLGSEDWAARKAAAEALCRVGASEKELLAGFKMDCMAHFESRRFDKVKIVRESMNRMIEVWKDIPSVDDGDDSGDLPTSKTRREMKNKLAVSRPPPNTSPVVTTRRKNILGTERESYPPSSHKIKSRRSTTWKMENIVSHAAPSGVVNEEKNARSEFGGKRLVFENKSEDKVTMSGGGLKSASRVVPFEETESSVVITEDNAKIEMLGDHKDSDLSLIRKQLLQIEKQQSGLLDLLQRFIGSSQNGIQSLETRVHGIEIALDGISYDLAVSSGKLPATDPAVTTCCSLPGAEFLSPKFWRRTDGGRYSLSGNTEMAAMRLLAEQRSGERYKERVKAQKNFVVNPLAEFNPQSIGNLEVAQNKILRSAVGDGGNTHTLDRKMWKICYMEGRLQDWLAVLSLHYESSY